MSEKETLNISYEVVCKPGGLQVSLKQVSDGLNAKYQALKKSNPRGYRDEFDSRFEILCEEVAQELGGVVTAYPDGDGDGVLVMFFDFTGDRLIRKPATTGV